MIVRKRHGRAESSQPGTSTLNVDAGATINNGTIIPLRGEEYSGTNIERIFNLRSKFGSVDLIVDIAGVFRT